MIQRALIFAAAVSLAACSADNVAGTAATRDANAPQRLLIQDGIAVQGDEGSSLTLATTSTLSVQNGALTVQWDFGDGSPSVTNSSATGDIAVAHTWDDNASAAYVAHATVTDVDGGSETIQFNVTIANVAPTATLVAPSSVNAGQPYTVSLSSPHDPSQADAQAGFLYQFDCGDGLGMGDPAPASSVTCAGGAPGDRTVYGRISDKDGDGTFYEGLVTIVDACTAPTAATLTTPSDPVQVGATVTATVQLTGAADAGTTVTLTWNDGVTATATPSGGVATFTRSFAGAGVYTATAVASNGCGSVNASASAGTYTVIFDPSAGFVTGGGWIMAPAGSYTADPSLSGKSTFGFVAKYLKGANVPTGNTEFQFHANGLDFKSGAYEWLVIAGTRAQYKGEGTIKGRSGTFKFLLTAIDNGPGGQNDAFRLKITDANGGVVFDNKQGSADNSNDSTTLAGGSISIKKN